MAVGGLDLLHSRTAEVAMAGTLHACFFPPPAAGNVVRRPRIARFPSKSFPYLQHTLPSNSSYSSILSGARTIPQICRASASSDETGGYARELNDSSGSANLLTFAKPVLKFVVKNFLPLALVSGVTLGFTSPSLGCLAHKYSLSKLSCFGIFLISGLMLRDGEISAAKEAWPVGIFGLVSILLVSPLLSHIIMKLHFAPQEFVTGLAIFCCMPTTLSSGVALTTLVKGNSALALAMTIISNMLGTLIVPFLLSKFVAGGVGVSIPTQQLFKSLIVTLLVPLIVGKVFRNSHPSVAEVIDQNRQAFSMTSAVLLSMVPWIQVSKSRPLLLMVKPVVFFMAIGLGIFLHIILLVFNTVAVDSFALLSGRGNSAFGKKENARAVVLVSSQKTLPVMVAVVEQLGGALGESGLLLLPCVAAHINQIILDSFLVNFWLHREQSYNYSKGL